MKKKPVEVKKENTVPQLRMTPDLVIQLIEEFLMKSNLVARKEGETVVIDGVNWSDAPFVIDYSLKKGGV